LCPLHEPDNSTEGFYEEDEVQNGIVVPLRKFCTNQVGQGWVTADATFNINQGNFGIDVFFKTDKLPPIGFLALLLDHTTQQ
jgi:hypothetical protein